MPHRKLLHAPWCPLSYGLMIMALQSVKCENLSIGFAAPKTLDWINQFEICIVLWWLVVFASHAQNWTWASSSKPLMLRARIIIIIITETRNIWHLLVQMSVSSPTSSNLQEDSWRLVCDAKSASRWSVRSTTTYLSYIFQTKARPLMLLRRGHQPEDDQSTCVRSSRQRSNSRTFRRRPGLWIETIPLKKDTKETFFFQLFKR